MKKTYNKLSLLALVMLSVLSCTSNKYDLENINTEITLFGDGIVAPIGHIDTLTVDSLIDMLDIDIIGKNENGDLKISLDSTLSFSIDAINIDPISDIIPELDPLVIDMVQNNFSFPEEGFSFNPIVYDYDVNLPSFTLDDGSTTLPTVNLTTPISFEGFSAIQNGLSIPGGLTLNPETAGTHEISLSFPCPDQVKRINKVWIANGGAKVKINFNFNSLASITETRTMSSLVVQLPQGYVIELENNLGGAASVQNGNKIVITDYNMGSSSLSVNALLKSIDMSHITPTTEGGERVFKYNSEVTYDLQCRFTTKAGVVSLSQLPSLNIVIEESELGDAEIVSNDITLEPIKVQKDLRYDLAGMSPDVASVKKVAFMDGSEFSISMNDLNLPFEGWDDCEVRLGLPDCFAVKESALVGATMNGNDLRTTLNQLVSGLQLPIAELNFGEEGSPVIDEHLVVDADFEFEISPVLPSATYLLSEITPAMGSKKIHIELGNSHFHIDLAGSQVTLHELSHDVNYVEPINQTIDNIPAELKRIETLSVADVNGDPITLDLAISITNSPIDHVILSDIQIGLPQCLWIEAKGLDENNTITIDQINVDIVEGEVIELLSIKVLGIRNLDVVDGKITIDDNVSIKAKAVVPEGEVVHGELDNITITPKIDLAAMYIKDVVGRVNIDLGSYVEPQSFDLSDIANALAENNIEATLGIKAPNILLEVSNPIGVAVDASIAVTASYPANDPLELNIPVHLNGAEDGIDGVTRLCLTANPALAPAGYTAITPEGYESLLDKIPSSIAFAIVGGITEEQECHITMGQPYDFNLNLSLQVPFEFNGNTDIRYKNTFEVGDTFSNFGEMGIEVGEIGIRLNCYSTLPFELEFIGEVVDVNNNPVNDIQLIIDGKIAGSADGIQPKNSQLLIGFKGNSNALAQVHAINFELKGSTGGVESKLNANQYLVADAILKAKDGITIDLKQLFDEMTTEDEE